MLFNSYIFIFAFLPLCILGFYLIKRINVEAAKIWLIIKIGNIADYVIITGNNII